MSDSLITGASGLTAAQQMLDVVGNNLANSNTVGFKSQNINFSDLVYQTLSDATGSTQDLSGTDPTQIGSGVGVGSIVTDNSQGTLNSTGGELDMAIQGNGYFVANSPTGIVYTRDGSFGIDSDGYLVDPATGDRIQRYGTVGEGTSAATAFQVPGDDDIQIPVNATIPGQATSTVDFQGNLSASAAGPQAEVLTTAQPFTTSSGPATANTLLNDLTDNETPYGNNAQILIQGTTDSGAPVSDTLTVGPTSTLGDVVNAINSTFTGDTASIDANGNLVVTSNNTGPSKLSVSISDVSGGATDWANHALTPTTTGSNGDTVQASIQVYDTQGTAHNLNLTFQKQSNGTWNLTAQVNPSDGVITSGVVSGISFNSDGSFRSVSGNSSIVAQFAGLSAPQTINLSFGSPGGFNGLTGTGGASGATASTQNGFAAGSLSSLTVGQDGTISGNFSNGQTLAIAQIAIASFANPEGLDRIGNNYYSSNVQSGNAQIGAAEANGNGSIQQGSLEQSNVDISTEFTQLIIAQRAYQVNAQTINISAQVVQDLFNIIH